MIRPIEDPFRRAGPRRSVVPGLLLLLLLLTGGPSRLSAQGQEPLLKSDVIRLLTSNALSKEEVASLVRRNCLAFEPTSRDLVDFRALGADAAVLNAIEECSSRRNAALEVEPRARRITAPAGGQATLTVQVTRGGQAVPDVELVLQGSRALPGLGSDLRATSDRSGLARFRVPAGNSAASYRFEIGAAERGPVRGPTTVLFTVTAAPAATVEVEPTRVEVSGRREDARIRVRVLDRYGNALAGAAVTVRPATPGLEIPTLTRSADDRGIASFDLEVGGVRRDGQLGVSVAGEQLASVAVDYVPVVASAELSGFVSGVDQVGTAGEPLSRPIVFEARDASGLPIEGRRVEFEALNAEVEPAVATTDAQGRARAEIRAGTRAAMATVTAAIDDVRKRAEIRVEPGSPAELRVLRGSAPLTEALRISDDRPVELRVGVVDEHGNSTLVSAVRTSIEDEALLELVGVTVDSIGAALILDPRRSGTTGLTVQASGLTRRLLAELALPMSGPAEVGHTLLYGAGAILTPHAYVAEGPWDVFVTGGGSLPELPRGTTLDEAGSLVYTYDGRVEVGVSMYSTSEYGVHAKVQVIRAGPSWPGLAVGVLNLANGPSNIGRHGLVGAGRPYASYIERASPYAAVSYTNHAERSPLSSTFTLGWGAGHFLEKNRMYSESGRTSGFFGSAMLDIETSPNVLVRFALEHDAWDVNAGASVMLYGLEFSLGLLGLEEGDAEADGVAVNQMRFFARIGTNMRQARALLGF